MVQLYKFTPQEENVLQSLVSLLYNECGYSDVDKIDLATVSELSLEIVNECLDEFEEKEIVFKKDDLIYLCENYYFLHEHWSIEKGLQYVTAGDFLLKIEPTKMEKTLEEEEKNKKDNRNKLIAAIKERQLKKAGKTKTVQTKEIQTKKAQIQVLSEGKPVLFPSMVEKNGKSVDSHT